MSLADWFRSAQAQMDAAADSAQNLRSRLGADAEAWCERELSRADRAKARVLRQLQRVLRHTPKTQDRDPGPP